MRVTFVGASPLAVLAAKRLSQQGHEVVLIDEDGDKIEALSDQLDCGLVVGDGTRPAVLEEISPETSDFLFCLSDRDEANILSALVGRSLGFDRVVPKVDDPDLETICTELGLDEVIVPDREVAAQLADLVEGRDAPDLTTVVRSGLRFFGLKVPAGVDDGNGLDLPQGARMIAVTRGDESMLADMETRVQEGDEVVLIVEEGEIQGLRDRFSRNGSGDGNGGSGEKGSEG
jgi:trk system potassium uptake protein TrkA